jgi:hypothetical protein
MAGTWRRQQPTTPAGVTSTNTSGASQAAQGGEGGTWDNWRGQWYGITGGGGARKRRMEKKWQEWNERQAQLRQYPPGQGTSRPATRTTPSTGGGGGTQTTGASSRPDTSQALPTRPATAPSQAQGTPAPDASTNQPTEGGTPLADASGRPSALRPARAGTAARPHHPQEAGVAAQPAAASGGPTSPATSATQSFYTGGVGQGQNEETPDVGGASSSSDPAPRRFGGTRRWGLHSSPQPRVRDDPPVSTCSEPTTKGHQTNIPNPKTQNP